MNTEVNSELQVEFGPLSAIPFLPDVQMIDDGFALCDEQSLTLVYCNFMFRKWFGVHDLSSSIDQIIDTVKTDILLKRLAKRGAYAISILPKQHRYGLPGLLEASFKLISEGGVQYIAVHVRNMSKLLEKDALIQSHSRMIEQSNRQLARLTQSLEAENLRLSAEAEEALRESERRLRLIVEATPISIVISRKIDSIIVYANEIAGPLVGLTTEELVGRKVTDFFNDPAEFEQLRCMVEDHGKADHFEAKLKTSAGNLIWADCSLRALDFNDEPSFLGSWHDITYLKQMNIAASRFVPDEFLFFLKKRSIVDIELGDHIIGDMTIMFSDIRSFTSVSENMSAKENFDYVNKYLGFISPLIRNHRGFVVKYLGDGIHAIFPESADDALRSCIEQLNSINDYNENSTKLGLPQIKVGIGLNTGRIMVGMVGESNRLQGDAFSDHVNLTARLEGLTKHYNVSLIISAATKEGLADPSKYHIRFLDRVQVNGKTKPLDLYEVYDADPPGFLARKMATQQEYEEAMVCYYAHNFTDAQTKLFRVLQDNPKDKVAWRHLMEVTECIENGVSEGWTGVTVMTNK